VTLKGQGLDSYMSWVHYFESRKTVGGTDSVATENPQVLGVYFRYMGAKSPWQIELKFFWKKIFPDVITCFKFCDDRLRGLASAEGQILPFPIDFDGHPSIGNGKWSIKLVLA